MAFSFTSLMLAALLTAQQQPGQQPSLAPPLRPLDQAVEDAGPLSMSLRELQVDLRQPMGFGQVYRVPGRDDLLMRVSGGLYAMFPESAYVQTPRGPLALIPPGTVFHIGAPAPLELPPPPHPDQIDRRVWVPMIVNGELVTPGAAPPRGEAVNRTPGLHAEPPDAATVVGPTFLNDERYRSERIEALMRRAAAAAATRGSGD